MPEARVVLGPAAARVPHRVVALPARVDTPSASSASSALTPAESAFESSARAVDARIRMELEFREWVVIDAESLNGTLRDRVESTTKRARSDAANQSAEATTTVTVGPGAFLTSSPELREEVLNALEVDAVIETTLSMGPLRQWSRDEPTNEQAVVVGLSISSRRDRALLVHSTCAADAGAYANHAQAADRAARCAVGGVLLALGAGVTAR